MKATVFFLLSIIIITACQSKNSTLSEPERELKEVKKKDQTDTIAFKLNRSLGQPTFNRVLIEGELCEQKCIFLLDNGCLNHLLDPDIFDKISNKFTINKNGYYVPKNKTVINFQNYSLNLDSIKPMVKENRIDGVLGYDFFYNKIIEIDFKHNVIVIHSILPKLESFIELPLLMVDSATIELHKRHRVIPIDGLLTTDKKEISCRFLFDFGSPMSIFSPSLKQKINLKERYDPNTLQDNLLNSIIPPHEDLGLRRNGKDFFEYDFVKAWKIDGFIGVDFLANYHLFIDYQQSKIYIKSYK